MLNEQEMKEMIDAAKPGIIEKLKKDIVDGISYEVKNAAAESIRKFVEVWVNEEIIPSLKKSLFESKDGLISVGEKMTGGIVKAVVESLTLATIDKLKNSWTRQAIVKAMFE